jgi:hypothetical protein
MGADQLAMEMEQVRFCGASECSRKPGLFPVHTARSVHNHGRHRGDSIVRTPALLTALSLCARCSRVGVRTTGRQKLPSSSSASRRVSVSDTE